MFTSPIGTCQDRFDCSRNSRGAWRPPCFRDSRPKPRGVPHSGLPFAASCRKTSCASDRGRCEDGPRRSSLATLARMLSASPRDRTWLVPTQCPKWKGIKQFAVSMVKSLLDRRGLSNAATKPLPQTSSRHEATRTEYDPATQGNVGVKLHCLSS